MNRLFFIAIPLLVSACNFAAAEKEKVCKIDAEASSSQPNIKLSDKEAYYKASFDTCMKSK